MTDKTLNILKDNRSNCYSVMINYSVQEYLRLIESAYKNKGGLTGQRDVLKTSTAKRIRGIMIDDLKKKALLPPLVIGIILNHQQIEKLSDLNNEKQFKKVISDDVSKDNIAIIDGMQRTTAIVEVVDDFTDNSKREEYREQTQLRVEFWIANTTNSLIYRMLVLNTGQVPWNLRRQIEVILNPVITEIKASDIPLEIIAIDDSSKRKKGGQYQADKLIELFLAFGLRKVKIDLKERLADEFSRLDFIEATASQKFTDEFKTVLGYLVKLDQAFDQYCLKENEGRFKVGKHIFDSQPAQIGFIVACAIEIMGRPGVDRTQQEQEDRLAKLAEGAKSLLNKLKQFNDNQLGEFLALTTLNETITNKDEKRFGDFERSFFLAAFETLIQEKFQVDTLIPCWRAY